MAACAAHDRSIVCTERTGEMASASASPTSPRIGHLDKATALILMIARRLDALFSALSP